jgi:hypothetical protein
MPPILVDDRLDDRPLGDLMDQRVGIVAFERAMATAAGLGLARRDGGELLGRDHGPLGLGMARLTAPPALAGGKGRLPLDSRRVGGWRPG